MSKPAGNARRAVVALGALVLGVLGSARPAAAWRTTLDGSGRARAVVGLADGRVVAAGELGSPSQFTVVQLDPTTGAELWRYAPASGSASGLAVDNSGDLLVAGRLGGSSGVGVVKLDDADGSELWRFRVRRISLVRDGVVPFGRAANGDAYLGVTRYVADRDAIRGSVVRLQNGSGVVAWMRDLGRRFVVALAVDPDGNPVVATSATPTSMVDVVKLNRSNGATLWTRTTTLRAQELALAVLSTGDVAAGGGVEPDGDATLLLLGRLDGVPLWNRALGASVGSSVRLAPTKDANLLVSRDGAASPASTIVARLAGSNGDQSWSTTIRGPADADCGGTALFSAPGNVPVVGGCATVPPSTAFRFQVAKLSVETGARLWARGIDGAAPDENVPAATVLALQSDASGNFVAAGASGDGEDAPAFTVVKWNGERGDDLVTSADRSCRQAIIRAGNNYVFTRLQVLEACRDRINAGILSIGFKACPTDPGVANTLNRLATRTRSSIVKACTGESLPPGVSCADTLDDLIGPDGNAGCLVTIDDAVDEAVMDVAYAKVLTGLGSAAAACQTAIGTAGRRVFLAARDAITACRANGPLSVDDCVGDPTLEAAIAGAVVGNRSRVSSACPSTVLLQVQSCATTLDGLLGPDGTSGCLLTSSRPGAEAASEAHD